MYYVFSNAITLQKCMKEKEAKDVAWLFLKTKVKSSKQLNGDITLAKVQYQDVCNVLSQGLNEEERDMIRRHACKIFADAWDIEALKMLQASPHIYGELTDDAKNVLFEYSVYEKISKEVLNANKNKDSFEEKVPIGYDGFCICVKYSSNGLSFFREGVEYTV